MLFDGTLQGLEQTSVCCTISPAELNLLTVPANGCSALRPSPITLNAYAGGI